MAGKHNTVGIDLVAMSVNDAICCGAEPLFFLDYVAMSHDDPELLEQIVEGISEGCVQADCALLGGETAIMPDLYAKGDYDLAGFCVGVVERKHLITGQAIDPDDRVLGIASSGLHSNGYSLARKVAFDLAQASLDSPLPGSDQSVGQALLEPTRIYAAAIKQVLAHYKVKNVIHGIAHITGGGLQENLERILPKHVDVEVDASAWDVPPIFPWIQAEGDVEQDEMQRVFNMGIGMTLVVSPFYANSVRHRLEQSGFTCSEIGRVTAGSGRVRFV